jgi:hypothetical protein
MGPTRYTELYTRISTQEFRIKIELWNYRFVTKQSHSMFEIPDRKTTNLWGTRFVSDLEVVLDNVWIKHWEYKSSITFKLLMLQI